MLPIGARYYEPSVGRWTSADKWQGDLYQPLSLNRYLYCEDEPVNAVDPSGRIPLLLAIGVGAVGGLLLEGAKDYFDDGRFDDPWWYYVGSGTLGGITGGIAAIFRGVATIGIIAIKAEIHGPHHIFDGKRLPHLQFMMYQIGVKGSHRIWRIPLPEWWPWYK